MTIDEAIKYARKVAERKKKAFQNCEDDCRFCLASKPCNEIAEEQEQIAEWLEELQLYKQGNCTNDCEHFDNGVAYGYNKAIDDLVLQCKKVHARGLITNWGKPFGIEFDKLDEVAQQLKEGAFDGN